MQNSPKPFYGNETSQNDAMRKAKAEALMKTKNYMGNLDDRRAQAKQQAATNFEPYAYVSKDDNGWFDSRDGSRLYTRETMPDSDPRKGKPLIGDYFSADVPDNINPRAEWGNGFIRALGGNYNSTPEQRSALQKEMEQGWITGGDVGPNPTPAALQQRIRENQAKGAEMNMMQQRAAMNAPSLMGGGNNLLANAFTNPLKKLR